MRGKYIFSLSMAVVLFSVLLTGISVAPTTPTIRLDPATILKAPGDVFTLNVWVDNVVNLYTYAFELHYAPFTKLLLVQTIKDGGFLGSDGKDVDFTGKNDPMPGVLVVGNTRIGEVGGISGSGIIAKITFKVKTTGTCDLTLASTELIDASGNHIAHNVINAIFYTPYAQVKAGTPKMLGFHDNSGVAKLGLPFTLDCIVQNTIGTMPLTVKVRYELTRTDGRKVYIWSPQPRTVELNVNGYADMGGSSWTTVGSAPYLDAVGDGNYVEDANMGDYIGFFDLNDISLLANEQIVSISLEAYSQAAAVGTTAEVYVMTSEMGSPTAVGIIEADTAWSWTFTEYPGMLAYTLYNEATINSAQLAFLYTAGESKITIDAVRLFITVVPVIVVQPGQTVTMPTVTYTFTSADKGKYPSVKAYCYYSFQDGPFIRETGGQPLAMIAAGSNPKTRYVLIVNPTN